MIEDLTAPPPLQPGALRVTALGGIGEIGRNMTVFEHLGRLLIVDCGVLFPSHDEPGVDLILHASFLDFHAQTLLSSIQSESKSKSTMVAA